MNVAMALLALVILTGFLGILVIHVPRTDLLIVTGVTLLLVAWDLYTTFRRRKN